MSDLELLEEFLTKFVAGDMTVINYKSMGLCSNSGWYGVRSCEELIEILAAGWEHHSGNPCFPVPEEDYHLCESKYEGQALEYRLSLAQYLLDKIDSHEDSL